MRTSAIHRLTLIARMLFFIRESRISNNVMNLKPQDVLFLLKLVATGKQSWSFNQLAYELGMSASEVHAAAQRSLAASLATREGDTIRPDIRNLEEFLLHGVQYVFVPDRGEINQGMPTAHVAEPLTPYFTEDKETSPVWPDPEGEMRGESFSPLYRSAPKAAKNDPALYQLLALVDVIRGGKAREREIAKKELKKRLSAAAKSTGNKPISKKDRLVIGETLVVSRAALKKLAQHHHIQRLALFGSAARGRLEPGSDIDLLVEFEKGNVPSLGGMVKINDDLATLFGGRKVDVATPAILNNPYRKQAIERDMEELYAA